MTEEDDRHMAVRIHPQSKYLMLRQKMYIWYSWVISDSQVRCQDAKKETQTGLSQMKTSPVIENVI